MAKKYWTPDEGVDLVSAGLNTAHKTAVGASLVGVGTGVLVFAVLILVGAFCAPLLVLVVMCMSKEQMWACNGGPAPYVGIATIPKRFAGKGYDKKFGAWQFQKKCKWIAWIVLAWIISASIYYLACISQYR